MALTSGTRLGPYEITAQIGEGGMGEVYMRKVKLLAAVLGLAVFVGQGCSGGGAVEEIERGEGGAAQLEGDTSKVPDMESRTGLSLPSDAAIQTSIDNDQAYLATYNTRLSVEEVQSFYETEFAAKGYTESRGWMEFAAAGFSSTSAIYVNGEHVVNVGISEGIGGSVVNFQQAPQ